MTDNKTDRNDALDPAQIMRTGWYREVRVKSADSRLARNLLASRAMLVAMRRDLENQVRGLLKTFGILFGKPACKRFSARAEELVNDHPALAAGIRPLLAVRANLVV